VLRKYPNSDTYPRMMMATTLEIWSTGFLVWLSVISCCNFLRCSSHLLCNFLRCSSHFICIFLRCSSLFHLQFSPLFQPFHLQFSPLFQPFHFAIFSAVPATSFMLPSTQAMYVMVSSEWDIKLLPSSNRRMCIRYQRYEYEQQRHREPN